VKVTVVGGGPVGLYAAIAGAQSGLDVTVVERRDGPIDKACGEGLMPEALGALGDIGVDPSGVSFHGIRYLDASGRRQVHGRLSGGPGRGVRRTVLMAALQNAAARSGVETVQGHVVGVEQDDTHVDIALESGRTLRADAVLACDGLGSGVRNALGLECAASGRARYGLRRHYRVAPWSDDVEVYWSGRSEAYVTPVAEGLVGVALLGERGGPFDERLADFPALGHRLETAEPIGQVLGAGPLRRQAVEPALGRVMLVGDAAGYVDALTGEGLALAFGQALRLGPALATGDLAGYARAARCDARVPETITRLALFAARRPALARRLVGALAADPALFARLLAALGAGGSLAALPFAATLRFAGHLLVPAPAPR
jgi:flavin-dependent dehydrogenase